MVEADEILIEGMNDVSSPVHTTLTDPDAMNSTSSFDDRNNVPNISTSILSPLPVTQQIYHEEPVSRIAAIILGDREGEREDPTKISYHKDILLSHLTIHPSQ